MANYQECIVSASYSSRKCDRCGIHDAQSGMKVCFCCMFNDHIPEGGRWAGWWELPRWKKKSA